MTWTFPPLHIQWAFSDATGTVELIEGSDLLYTCSSGPFTFECYAKESKALTMDFPLATLLAGVPDIYDWYTLTAWATFPRVPPGTAASGDCNVDGCGDPENGDSAGTVSGVTLVRPVDGATVPLTATSDSTGNGWTIPSDGSATYAVALCPTPSYPVPDAFGNTSGAVLWTRAQLDAFAASPPSLAYSGHWGFVDPTPGPGDPDVAVRCGVGCWNETTAAEPPTDSWQCVL